MQSFLEALNERIILADGGMGTQLYERGVFINRCYDELNISNAALVKKVHQDYIDAGAELIESNTFTANRLRLAPYGLEDKVVLFNQAGVRNAKEAGGGKVWVAGAVGPTGVVMKPLGRIDPEEVRKAFKEQLTGLIDAGADVILFETFMSIDELRIAVEETKKISPDIPIIAQISFKYYREEEFLGLTPEEAIAAIETMGVAVGGTNCSSGPQGVLEIVRRMRKVSGMKLSAMPNAGMPQVIEGRLHYLATPEYMGEYAKRLALAGANLIGGCCGTTPKDINEMSRYLKSIQPSGRVSGSIRKHKKTERMTPIKLEEKSSFAAKLGKEFLISVELDPPAIFNTEKVLDKARFLRDNGADAVNIPDGPRAMARMSPMALGLLVKEKVGVEPIVHYCCRDRNLLGMQMDLIGADALGLHNLLIITGDPPKMGTYPAATAVFDVDSIGLVHLVNELNHGVDLVGHKLGAVTRFLVGCGCNPGAINIELEVERYRQKVASGAEYVFSQPIYDPELLERFFELTKDIKRLPFFVGIFPLTSLHSAEFVHNEIPGMQVPEKILKRMHAARSNEKQRETGLAIAREMLTAARSMERVNGAYVLPPFSQYKDVAEVLKGI